VRMSRVIISKNKQLYLTLNDYNFGRIKVLGYCLGPLERGKDGMTSKGGLQRRQHRQTLFAECGQVATNASKGLSESLAAEAAGDFLLHLDHAKISLGQVIVKIYPQILQEGEDGLLLFAQAIEQIACVTLFASTPFARGSRSPRVRLIPVIEQPEELRFPIHDFQRPIGVLALRATRGPAADARCKRHAHSRTRSTIPTRREPRSR